jgi:hypothetical protein
MRLELLDCIPDRKKLILYTERARLVSELAETLHDVELGLETKCFLRTELVE